MAKPSKGADASPNRSTQRPSRLISNTPHRSTRLIDLRIEELNDWRGLVLAQIRRVIRRAERGVVEEWKWNVPVWSHPSCGIICTGETYKNAVKLTFARGAALPDPSGLFNSSLEGRTRRAMDIHEGDAIDDRALAALVRAAVAAKPASAATRKRPTATRPRLLAGGNPQIAKGEGDAPVQAYIAAMPGWKRQVGQRLDALIVRVVPNVHKAVKWNSPLYGIADQGWFLSLHCFTKYVKLAFFRGRSLRPLPPGESKMKNTRYVDLHEGDLGSRIDEAQLADWVMQASRLPCERL